MSIRRIKVNGRTVWQARVAYRELRTSTLRDSQQAARAAESDLLKALQAKRALANRALADRAEITRKYVVDLEAGRYDPTVGVLRRIAKALGVPVAELIG